MTLNFAVQLVFRSSTLKPFKEKLAWIWATGAPHKFIATQLVTIWRQLRWKKKQPILM